MSKEKAGSKAGRPRNRFLRGSGCYTCHCCQRKTRSTGRGDNENCDLCAQCYDWHGIANIMADNGETPELLAEWNELLAEIKSLGGTPDEEHWWAR